MANTYAKPMLGFSTNAIDSQRKFTKRQIEIEEITRLQKELWRVKPLIWLRERMNEDPANFKWSIRPGYEEHVWDGDKDPLSEAWMALARGEWAGVEAATGTSKTYWLARVVCWFLDCWEDSLVVTSAPKQDQLTLHLWAEITKIVHKFKKIQPDTKLTSLKLKVKGSFVAVEDVDEDAQDLANSWMAVGFVAGTSADEQSATKAQGFHREHMLIILEETPGMPLPVLTAFKNTSTGGHNLILAVGNPDSELDALHTFCSLENVCHKRISAFDYPNVVHGVEIFPGAVTRASIERRRIEYGVDSILYQSRVRGICPTSAADSLVKLEWVNSAHMRKIATPAHGTMGALGLDVAASENGDKAAAAWGTGPKLLAIEEFACPNPTHLAYNLLYESTNPFVMNLRRNNAKVPYYDYNTHKLSELGITEDFVGVDVVGVGVATVNAFKDRGWTVQGLSGGQWPEAIPKHIIYDDDGHPKEVLMYRFKSLRAQMYWELREDFRLERISLWIDDQTMIDRLKKELCIIKFVIKADYIEVESKEEIKKRLGGKSPNIADAVVYWNWIRKGYRLGPGALPFMAAALG